MGLTYAYAHASARTENDDRSGEPYALAGNSQMHIAPLPLFPLRATARYSPAAFMDVGADVGLLGVGLQLRAGWLDAQRQLPWGLELE